MVAQGALDHPLVLLYGTLLPSTRKVVEKKPEHTNFLLRLHSNNKNKSLPKLFRKKKTLKLLQEHTFKSDLESNTL